MPRLVVTVFNFNKNCITSAESPIQYKKFIIFSYTICKLSKNKIFSFKLWPPWISKVHVYMYSYKKNHRVYYFFNDLNSLHVHFFCCMLHLGQLSEYNLNVTTDPMPFWDYHSCHRKITLVVQLELIFGFLMHSTAAHIQLVFMPFLIGI